MNAILMSINPRWCELILSGQKNVEVRKRIPQRFGAPFRVYLYRTRKSGSAEWDGMIVGEFICDRVYGLERDEYVYIYDLNGLEYDKWIWVDGSERFDQTDRRDLRTYLSGYEMSKYAKGSDKLYGLHVSEVKRYERPVTIEELTRCRHLDRERVCGSFMTLSGTGGSAMLLTRMECPYQHVDYFNPNYRPNECECRRKVNTNAPQSWQYVDDTDAQAAVERMNPIRVETP